MDIAESLVEPWSPLSDAVRFLIWRMGIVRSPACGMMRMKGEESKDGVYGAASRCISLDIFTDALGGSTISGMRSRSP